MEAQRGENPQESEVTGTDTVSFTPVANQNNERLDLDSNDPHSKDNTESLPDQCESVSSDSEPPAKRARHEDAPSISTSEACVNNRENDVDSSDGRESFSHNSLALDDGAERIGTHEFEIIDEVAADEDDEYEEGDQDSDESLDDTELYALLEEGITKDTIANADRPIEREKVVLVGTYLGLCCWFPTISFLYCLNCMIFVLVILCLIQSTCYLQLRRKRRKCWLKLQQP